MPVSRSEDPKPAPQDPVQEVVRVRRGQSEMILAGLVVIGALLLAATCLGVFFVMDSWASGCLGLLGALSGL